jgi:hypothetical protein
MAAASKPYFSSADAPAAVRPVLHLSGAKLRLALEALIRAAEPIGGIERFAAAVKLKSDVLQDRLGTGKAASIERDAFEEVTILMATVRRRISGLIDTVGWPCVRAAVVELLHDAHTPGSGDTRVAVFKKAFPDDKANRFVRDLASELLHGVYPEHYPLMHRWVWDARANTGVIREIWHDPTIGDDVDSLIIDIPDGHETFLVLREELPRHALVRRSAAGSDLRRLHQRAGRCVPENRFFGRGRSARAHASHSRP